MAKSCGKAGISVLENLQQRVYKSMKDSIYLLVTCKLSL